MVSFHVRYVPGGYRMFTRMAPKQHANTVFDIDLEKLKQAGIRGIITDLDNTLVGAKAPNATPELVNWFAKLRAYGFSVVIVSNNGKHRVSRFSDPLGLPYIYKAKKPIRTAFRQALGMMNLQASETAVIGDQMVTDVLGGNRMGLHTILVKPIAPADEGFFTRINRRIEKAAIASLRKKGLHP
ncbi:YqeG family HAD IIIA-type phosphatase [Paenibacillus turpanensis]|uniref:YqeG family HAD IIIA-type phosphatase n=1 Tax=Paenibacillus turpanensis TaxID=2689078 RepID=UPI003132B4DD